MSVTRGYSIVIVWRVVKALLIYIAPLDDGNILGWLVYRLKLMPSANPASIATSADLFYLPFCFPYLLQVLDRLKF